MIVLEEREIVTDNFDNLMVGRMVCEYKGYPRDRIPLSLLQCRGPGLIHDPVFGSIEYVVRIPTMPEEFGHLFHSFSEVSILTAETSNPCQLRVGNGTLARRRMGRPVIQICVGICRFVVNRCGKTSAGDGDIYVEE